VVPGLGLCDRHSIRAADAAVRFFAHARKRAQRQMARTNLAAPDNVNGLAQNVYDLAFALVAPELHLGHAWEQSRIQRINP
jgi:hypothetical protein